MENVKNYRVKTKSVRAMRTYLGQPLYEIRDFMIGYKNIILSLGFLHEGFNETIEGSEGASDLTPGDYIVMSEDRNAAFMTAAEFEDKYEEQIDNRELYYVIKNYGFPVEDAVTMLRTEWLRPILLAPLHEQSKASKRSQNTNITISSSEADIERIANSVKSHLNSMQGNLPHH